MRVLEFRDAKYQGYPLLCILVGGGLIWDIFYRTLSSGGGEYLTFVTDNKLRKIKLSKTEAVVLYFAF